MQSKKLIAICVCLSLLLAGVPAMPQIFGGIPVIDAANLAESLIQSAHMVSELQRLFQMYQQMQAQFQHMQQQAKYLRDMARYRSIATVWRQVQAQDWYNKNAPWVKAVNLGVGASKAWETMSRAPTKYPDLKGLSAAIQELRTDEVGAIQLADGTAINTIEMVGQIRMAGPSREAALAQLESDSFSADSDMQTEAAQLNKIAALLSLVVKSQLDQNRLSTNALELHLLRTKLERDAMVNALNEQTYAQSNAPGFLVDTGDGPSAGLRDFLIK